MIARSDWRSQINYGHSKSDICKILFKSPFGCKNHEYNNL